MLVNCIHDIKDYAAGFLVDFLHVKDARRTGSPAEDLVRRERDFLLLLERAAGL